MTAARDGERPEVSVLIPTYNRRALLPQAMRSALTQEGVWLEVVVVDDGSTDGTSAYVETQVAAYPGRVRLVRQPNSGQPSAINRGLEVTRGEFVSILSDDDELLPGALAALASALRGDPGAVVAGGRFETIDVDGTVTGLYTPPGLDLAGALADCETQFGPGTMVRAAALPAIGGWNPDFRSAPDLEFWLRCGLVGSFVFTSEVVALYRHHVGSVTQSDPRPAFGQDYIDVLTAFFERDDLPPDVLAVKAQAFRTAYFRAGTTCGAGINGTGERYFVDDRLGRIFFGTDPGADRDAETRRVRDRVAELHHDVDWLHAEVASRDELIRQLGAQVAERTATLHRLQGDRRAAR